ncbi:ATP-binding protein [Streptomyces microflavus]|uniref:ATP-binding protein n=1 Tax=Streptomyces microflavus TaxID=1919 RepID=UPI00366A5467
MTTHSASESQTGSRAAHDPCRWQRRYVDQPKVDPVVRSLRHEANAAGEARCMAQEVLMRWNIDDDDIDDMLLVISELVTNAVEHALPPVVLQMQHDPAQESVWIGVRDSGPGTQAGSWIASCADDEHGRGLKIVAALATSRGREFATHGRTTHWVEFRRDAD